MIGILIDSYKLKHAEVLALESYFSRIFISSMTAFIGVFVYAVNFDKTDLVGFLPALVCLSALFLAFITSGVIDLGYFMARIESQLKAHGHGYLNWESSHGAVGQSRISQLPSLIMIAAYFSIYLAVMYLLAQGSIVDTQRNFVGINLQQLCLWSGAVLGVVVLIVTLFLSRQMRQSRQKIFNEFGSL